MEIIFVFILSFSICFLIIFMCETIYFDHQSPALAIEISYELTDEPDGKNSNDCLFKIKLSP